MSDAHAPTESIHVACARCGARNRIPKARAAQDPHCGKCQADLLPTGPIELADANFDAVVGGTELPIVVDFHASWCGPCHAMAPAFTEAAARLKGQALFVKVDIDVQPRTAGRFAIRSVPTVVRLRGGQEQARLSGARPVGDLVRFANA